MDEETFHNTAFRLVLKDGQQDRIKAIRERAAQYILIDDVVYEECGEPRYQVGIQRGFNPFVSIECVTEYSGHIPRELYFAANEYDKAVACAQAQVAQLGCRDVKLHKPYRRIRVLLPSAVTCQPSNDNVVKRHFTVEYTVTRKIDLTIPAPENATQDLLRDLVREALAKVEPDPSASVDTFTKR